MPLQAVLTGYLSGISTLAEFLTLPDDLLYRRPTKTAWCAAEVIHHLADYELVASTTYRRVLVEDVPVLDAWDEPAYGTVLRYRERPLLHSIGTITALRHSNIDILAELTPTQWQRTAVLPDSSTATLQDLVLQGTSHLSDRLAQARRAVNGAP